MAEINLKTLTEGGGGPAFFDVFFNEGFKGSIDSSLPILVQLSDGSTLITPNEAILFENYLDIIIPPPVTPSGVLFETIKPSQYTSYRTGDEGWRVQNGFFNYTPPTNPKVIAELDMTSTNFFNVLKSPLIVNGVSSTTRFVDVNGIQAFSGTGNADKVVIDKLTGLMYTRGFIPVVFSWNNVIDNALSYSIIVNSITYDDWFVPSFSEINTLIHNFAGIVVNNDTLTNVLLWQPQNNCWTSTTSPINTSSARRFLTVLRSIDSVDKTVSDVYPMYVRNARNLITAP
jgi:hypothetical protein